MTEATESGDIVVQTSPRFNSKGALRAALRSKIPVIVRGGSVCDGPVSVELSGGGLVECHAVGNRISRIA